MFIKLCHLIEYLPANKAGKTNKKIILCLHVLILSEKRGETVVERIYNSTVNGMLQQVSHRGKKIFNLGT